MPLLSRLSSLWRNLVHRDRVDRKLDDELSAVQQLLADEYARSGMAPAEAHRRATLMLGGRESVKLQVREVRTGAGVDMLVQDIRYACRLMHRNPLFALTASLSLAIGIGATTTIFTVANGLLLRSAVGVTDPNRLVDIVVMEGDRPGVTPMSYPDFLEIRRRADMFDGMYAYELEVTPVGFRVGDGGAERVFAGMVTTNFFSTLGVGSAAGRTFSSSDSEQPGAAPVVVLSHRFWAQRFSGDRSVVGQTVRVNSHPMIIVGVAADGFRGTGVLAPDLWVPTSMVQTVHPDRGSKAFTGFHGWLMVGARLRPGVTRAMASSHINALGQALLQDRPRSMADLTRPPGAQERPPASFRWSAEVSSPVPYGLRTVAAGFLALLMTIVAIVLAIACANVAGVLLARAASRRREMAVRAALGAGRIRIIRQLLTETLLLFALGGVGGLVLARGMTSLLVSLLPTFPLPVNLSVPLDARVVVFSLALTGVAAILSGLTPALHASRTDVASTLKDDSQGCSERMRLRNAFVVAQVALSMLLVVTAGLLVRAFDRMRDVDRGFDMRQVDTVSFDLSMASHTDATGAAFTRELLQRARALPGVEAATAADHAPGPRGHIALATIPGLTPPDGQPFVFMNRTRISPTFFDTLRIPLLAGRDFSDADREGAPQAAIVGETVAKRFWPGQDAVAQSLLLHATNADTSNATPTRLQIVGVARDLKFDGPGNSARLDLYVPLRQHFSPAVVLFAKSAAGSNVAALQSLVSSMDPNLPALSEPAFQSQELGPVGTQLRVAATVAGSIGLVGVLLAAMGTYGVTAHAVTRRTREIAIRLSFGALTTNVVTLVLRQGMTLVALGSAIGLTLGLAAGRLLSSSRFGVPASEPLVLVGATALFIVIGLLACVVPVLRASRINPMEALRYQ